jgi:glycosyltransferase involved in cell wall biosynthesis
MADIPHLEWVVPATATPVQPGPAPSFSVAIAAFQSAEVIGDALESLLAQTRRPDEIVVCDDGSTDDLESALRPYIGLITLLKQQNGGEGSAKNAAVRAASSEFVAILDADDTYLPTRLEALTALAATRPDLDILTTDAYLEAGGKVVRRCYTPDWTFEVEDQRIGILERNFIFGHVAVRRDRFLYAGGFDESIRWTTDWDCWLRMILAGSRAGCVMQPLAVYRVHEKSLSAERGRLVAGRLQTLTKTAARDDLSTPERAVLEKSITRYRRELALLELRAALREGSADARDRALGVARDSNYPRRVRLNAAAAALLPRMAGRRERRRAASSWVGAGGTRVARN